MLNDLNFLRTNVLTVVSLVATINGLMTWIGKGFGIHQLTLQLILRYVFYPVTFFIGMPSLSFYLYDILTTHLLGVPRNEILRVAELLATKLVENEFVAYSDLTMIMASDNPLSLRSFTITSYALCGFANLGSLGIQIGVLSALAPSRARIIARIATSAMICGFISYVLCSSKKVTIGSDIVGPLERFKQQVSQACSCKP